MAYPCMLWIPGHLHILYNGLKEIIQKQPECEDYFERLQIITSFLNDKLLRRRFQALCCRNDAVAKALFETAPKMHIDWKWSFLSTALDYIVPRVLVLDRYFHYEEMAAGDSGKLKKKVATISICYPVID